jgi:hypothetical protein
VGEWIDNFGLEFNDFHNKAGSKLFGQKKGKPDSSRVWIARAYLAKGVHIRMKSGLSRNKIIEELDERSFKKKFPPLKALVLQDKRTHKKRMDKNEERAVTLGNSALSWRDKLQQGSCRNVYAKATWAVLREDPRNGLDPIDYANQLFQEADARAANGSAGFQSGGGGGAGEEVVFWMTAAQIGASQSYVVGGSGSGGAAGGNAGGNGAAGVVIVEEF